MIKERDKFMKLVILGNGFDLASGLPTRYKDFFRYNYNNDKYRLYFEKIDKFLNLIKSSELGLSGIRYHEVYEYIENDLEINLVNDSKFIDEIAKNTQLSIWSIYFWFMNETLKIDNWSDVETQISEIIRGKYNLTSIDGSKSINEMNALLKGYLEKLAASSEQVFSSYSNNIYSTFEKEDRFRYICDYIIIKRYLGGMTSNM